MKRILFLIYIIVLIIIVWLIPSKAKSTIPLNLFPLHTIQLYITAFIHGFAPIPIILANLLGNILLTIPLGFLLCKQKHLLGKGGLIFFSIYIPCYIEFVQLLLHIGGFSTRSIDIDDVLLNMIGIWIGIFSSSLFRRKYST